MKKEILIIFLLLLISFPAVKSLLLPGGFTSHDLTHHVIRQISMDKLLSEGQFPPRWSGDLNNSYGYPVFLFNYPMPALLGEVFHKLGLGFVDSVKAVFLVSMVMSVLGMYLFLKSLLGLRSAAFLGATFYLYAPIRFLNVYVSASVGSALALAIVPFVFLALRRGNILQGSIFLAFLILSHNVTALIFAPVLLIFGFFLFKKVKATVIIFLLGLGLSAWFFLPAIWEKPYTRFDLIFADFYKDHFPSLWQLIRSPWGYGLSHPQNPQGGDMSYQLGIIHIGVMLVLGLWFRKPLVLFVLGGFILSIFLMLQNSQPLWDNLPFLNLVQFPWRFLSVSVFMAAVAAALLVKALPFKKIAFVILLVLVIYANRNHWNINEKFDPGEEYYRSLKTTSTTYGEHLPKWGRVMDKTAKSKLEFVEGGENIKIVKDQSAQVLAVVEATAASKLRFNQFYFPGWEIKIDDKSIDFDYKVDGESYGLPVFDIEQGRHKVLAEFKNTPDRNLADAISVVSVIVWLILLCRLLILR
ncbi:hypothetical protein KKE03_03660 [Patescibacteria group bacterium]|nr:hypothetical protein [Patescibacteria group bacterium]